MTYEAIDDDEGKAMGMIRLIGDIDDTIKISEVLDKVRLLANIFIFPSKTVSSTRDQLYTLTQEFINTNHFPDGSFHMRHFDWAITFLFDFLHCQSTFIHKMSYLRFFLSNIIREYVLIDDSAEKDLKIYGTIAREYLECIQAIKDKAFDDL